MTYSIDTYQGIFYMHYHIDMIKHNTAFDKPVSGTGWSKSVTLRWQVNFPHRQSEWNIAGVNHQFPYHRPFKHIGARVEPLPRPGTRLGTSPGRSWKLTIAKPSIFQWSNLSRLTTMQGSAESQAFGRAKPGIVRCRLSCICHSVFVLKLQVLLFVLE